MNDAARDIVIIVDDSITNLTIGKKSIEEKYDVLTAPSGAKLLTLLDRVRPSLILLDIEMPGMDGYEIIKELKASEKTADIPVVFLTAKIDPESEVKGLNLGAVDYITKPFSRELLLKRVDLHIHFEKQKSQLLAYSLNLESEVDKKTRTVIGLQSAILNTVAELVESRDKVTGGHIERTQRYLRMLVELLVEHGVYCEMISAWDVDLLIMSAQLHDVGKIAIKDSILMKPGKLTNEEFEEMKKHAEVGTDIIKRIEDNAPDSEFLRYAAIFAGSHHEKWNGNGYPNGITGENIPLEGRLMAIIDVYDALTNNRPYKDAYSHERAIEIIKEGVGTHFDPQVGMVFVEHEADFAQAMSGEPDISTSDDRRLSHYMASAMKAAADIADMKDDTGNPVGQKEKGIPIQGKIMAIIGVYDALVNDRPHRARKTHEEAVEIIGNLGGSHFDPNLVEVFLKCEKDFEAVWAER